MQISEITLPTTIYGGTYNAVSGVLTVTMGHIASYNGETIGEPWLSSLDEYEEGTTPTIGAEVVYTLDTPITYELTPQELEVLVGTNSVWSDKGDVTVDIKYTELTDADGYLKLTYSETEDYSGMACGGGMTPTFTTPESCQSIKPYTSCGENALYAVDCDEQVDCDSFEGNLEVITDDQGVYYRGDTATVTVTLENSGSDSAYINLYLGASGTRLLTKEYVTLQSGETKTYTATYEVTSTDVERGYIDFGCSVYLVGCEDEAMGGESIVPVEESALSV